MGRLFTDPSILNSLKIISDYLPVKFMEDAFKILSLDRVQLFADKVAVHGYAHVRKPLVIFCIFFKVRKKCRTYVRFYTPPFVVEILIMMSEMINFDKDLIKEVLSGLKKLSDLQWGIATIRQMEKETIKTLASDFIKRI